jgi:hypothetical protein
MGRINNSQAVAATPKVIAPHEAAMLNDLVFSAKVARRPRVPGRSSAGAVDERSIGTPVGEKLLERRKYRELVAFSNGDCRDTGNLDLFVTVRWARQLPDWAA